MRALLIEIGLVLAVAMGIAIGYVVWGTPTNWYAAVPDVAKLGPGAENDLIRYGKDLIVNIPRHIGKNATDPAMRYAGNNLACQNCHLNAGLQPFAAPRTRNGSRRSSPRPPSASRSSAPSPGCPG